jgi:N-acyl-L-homoserine lactone synthetase
VTRLITIIEDYNRHEHAHAALLHAMFVLRAASFCAWRLPVNAAGEERDRFDDMSPVYVISHHHGYVNGALRLLPSTGPTLFEEAFADSSPDGAGLSHPGLWECSRLCSQSADGTRTLLLAVADLAPQAGIETLIGNIDDRMQRLYRSMGLTLHVLGHTDRYGKRVYLATFDITDCTQALRRKGGR